MQLAATQFDPRGLRQWRDRAAGEVVIDQTHGLHEGVDRGRPDKGPATLFEIGRQLRCFEHRCSPFELMRGEGPRCGLEQPCVTAERAEFIDQLQHAFGIVDGRFDFATMAHDACISQQAPYLGTLVPRHALGIEMIETATEVLPLVEDGEPAQA